MGELLSRAPGRPARETFPSTLSRPHPPLQARAATLFVHFSGGLGIDMGRNIWTMAIGIASFPFQKGFTMNGFIKTSRCTGFLALVLAFFATLSPAWADTSKTISFGRYGGEQVVSFPCNGSYSGPSHSETWLTTSKRFAYSSGVGQLDVTVSCGSNSGSAKSGYIEMTIDGATCRIYVSQDGADGSSLEPDLAFYALSGWNAPVMVTKADGSTTPADTFAVGEEVHVVYSYKNVGTAAAGAFKILVELYEVKGETASDWDWVTGWSVTRSSGLEAGHSAYRTEDNAFDGVVLSPGSYCAAVFLDDDGQVDESDESNNTKLVYFSVVASSSKPDLCFFAPGGWTDSAFLSASTGGAKTTSFSTSSAVYLNFAYGNNGSTAVGAHKVNVALYESGSAVSFFSQTETVSSIVAGGGKRYSDWRVASNLRAGSYRAVVWLDCNNDVSEANENNNLATIYFTVVAPASTPTSTSSVSHSMAMPQAGGTKTDVFTFSGSSFRSPTCSVSWLSVSQRVSTVGGSGQATISVKAAANPSSAARTGVVTMVAGGTTYKLTVTQAGTSSQSSTSAQTPTSTPTPTTSVSHSMAMPQAGGTKTDVFTFSGSSFRSPTCSVSWLSVSQRVTTVGGRGQATISVKAAANPSAAARTGIVTMVAGNTTYKLAVTQARNYKVAFNANGGKGKMAAQTMVYGQTAKLRKNKFKRSGSVFAGWAVKKRGSVKYKNAASVANLRTDGKTTTLYAVWAKKHYKVAFKANGGKGSMSAQTMTYGKSSKLRKNAFKRKGYTFAGWAVKKGGAVQYKNRARVKNLRKDGKVRTLYAVWAKKSAKSVPVGLKEAGTTIPESVADATGSTVENVVAGIGKVSRRVLVTARGGENANAVADGDETTAWTTDAVNGAWVVLTFSEARNVEDVEVVGDNLPEGTRFLVSEDADDWREELPGTAQYLWVVFPACDGPLTVKEIRILPE